MSRIARASSRVRFEGRWRAELSDYVIALAWSPDGKRIAATAVSGAIRVFDSVSGSVTAALPGHAMGTNALDWHPDSTRLASIGQDGKAILWDVQIGQAIHTLKTGASWGERALWSPKGDVLATGGGETVMVWKFGGKGPEGTKPIQLAAHQDLLTTLAFQQRGDVLASGGQDGAVLAWLPGKREAPLGGLRGMCAISHVAWSPDDRLLAIGDDQGALIVTEIVPE